MGRRATPWSGRRRGDDGAANRPDHRHPQSPKEITVVTEVDNKGAWQKMGEDHCKKK
jgi:hypothetical protein